MLAARSTHCRRRLVEDAQQALVGGQAEAVICALQRALDGIDQRQGFGRLVDADLLAAEDRPGQQQWSADLFVGDGYDYGEALGRSLLSRCAQQCCLADARLAFEADSDQRLEALVEGSRDRFELDGAANDGAAAPRYWRNASGLE
jgi:hypothetical protein